jgi:hypothetical protein
MVRKEKAPVMEALGRGRGARRRAGGGVNKKRHLAPPLGRGSGTPSWRPPIATQRTTTIPWRLPLLLVPRHQRMAYEAVDRVLDSSSIVAAFLFQKASVNEGINFRFV